MLQVSPSGDEPNSKMTSFGLAFLTTSIVIGMGFGAGGDYSVLAGVAMLFLLALGFLSRAW